MQQIFILFIIKYLGVMVSMSLMLSYWSYIQSVKILRKLYRSKMSIYRISSSYLRSESKMQLMESILFLSPTPKAMTLAIVKMGEMVTDWLL